MKLPQKGDRVRMIGTMPNDPDPMEEGAEGTVLASSPGMGNMEGQIIVDWDNGRTLILLPSDPYIVTRKA